MLLHESLVNYGFGVTHAPPSNLVGTRDARERDLADLVRLAGSQLDACGPPPPAIQDDLDLAEKLIAGAMTKGSWARIKGWADKFEVYAKEACPDLVRSQGITTAFLSDSVTLAFLARVVKMRPGAKTCVKAATRAINLVRSLAGGKPLDKVPRVKLLNRAVRRSIARTVRQSPALTMQFARPIIEAWGSSHLWWKRMVATMIALALCIMARGAEICNCLREGMAWVRHDGTQVRTPLFAPALAVDQLGALSAPEVKGFLLLLSSRKNRQATPTWVPVISSTAVSLLVRHIRWLDRARGPRNGCLFPARVSVRRQGERAYVPSRLDDAHMSVQSFRALIREALVECCHLTPEQAAEFGTHSLRIGAMELLRKRGVPAEIRQQLGGWMSAAAALGYLQLPVTAQFNMLGRIFC